MPYLIYAPHTTEIRTYELLPGINTIGRAYDNTIAINQRSVSRYHAVIKVSSSAIAIKDLQSSNFTFVNEEKINESQLKHGDSIRCGQVEFRFVERLKQEQKDEQIALQLAQNEFNSSRVFKQFPLEKKKFSLQELFSGTVVGSILRLRQKDVNETAVNKLKGLLEVSKKLSSPDKLDRVLEKIIALLFEIIHLDRAAILLVDESTGKLEKKAVKSRGSISTEGEFYSTKIINWAYKQGKVMATADASKDARFQDSESITGQQIGASLCIPLKPTEQIIGVLYIDNLDIGGMYSDDDVEFVSALANQAAIAIYNAQLYTKVKESQRRLSQFLEAMPVGVSVHDAAGDIYYVNQTAKNLLGIAPKIGKEKEEWLKNDTDQEDTIRLYPIEEIPINRSLQGETVKSDELEIYQTDRWQKNMVIPIELSSTPIKDENGNVEYAIAAFQDISKRKEAEKVLADYNRTLEQQVAQRTEELSQALEQLKATQKQLVESEKMAALGSLVTGLAHEINTPIGVGLMAASTLGDRTREISEIYQSGKIKRSQLEKFLHTASMSTKMVLDNLHRAAELIQCFKQVSVDQSSEERRKFKVKEYVQEVLLSLSPKLKHTKHQVKVIGDENLSLDSYPGALSQIITNLLINSLTHAYTEEDEGFILIKIEAQDDEIVFIFADDGKGIRLENLEKIFEPFFTTNRGDGNTGLGLHLVYNLVTQKLKGKIKCESESGVGTRFIITLPLEC